MSSFLLITGVCIIYFLLKPLFLKHVIKKKKEKWIKWGLGVDYCCFYSRPFTVSNQSIAIHGFQEVVDKDIPICYSLVKKNWWGKRKVYGQSLISGDYKGSNNFQITIKNIPNGEDYQIEIYNGFNMSFGQFQIK